MRQSRLPNLRRATSGTLIAREILHFFSEHTMLQAPSGKLLLAKVGPKRRKAHGSPPARYGYHHLARRRENGARAKPREWETAL